jgi:hypothetical protein
VAVPVEAIRVLSIDKGHLLFDLQRINQPSELSLCPNPVRSRGIAHSSDEREP